MYTLTIEIWQFIYDNKPYFIIRFFNEGTTASSIHSLREGWEFPSWT